MGVYHTREIIDAHCHFLTENYVNALKKYDRINEDGFPIPSWDLESQLSYMEETGITHAVLSLSTPHQHFGEDAFAAELSRSINEEAAQFKKKYPDRFSFAACLPLPSVELALQETAYAYDVLGACGVKVPSQANGVYLGDARLEPLMEELDRRHSVILIHPSKPPVVPEGCFTSGPLPLLEFINDTTRAVVNLIATGTLEKYKNIRVVVPHCGSFLPNIIDRLTGITKVLAAKGVGKEVDVQKSLQSLYFDLAGDIYPRGIGIARSLMDDSHLLFGGDFPYTPVPMIEKKVRDMEADDSIQEHLDSIMAGNAKELFGLEFARRC